MTILAFQFLRVLLTQYYVRFASHAVVHMGVPGRWRGERRWEGGGSMPPRAAVSKGQKRGHQNGNFR